MGRFVLLCRLAGRDLRRRPGEAAMPLAVMTAATTVLTLGLVLGGATAHPYQATRAATAGPDVLATAFSLGGGQHACRPWPPWRRSPALAA